MRLILVRHAEAVAKGEDGVTRDFDRHLTPFGRQQAAALATALAQRGLTVGAVLTSPLVRARQTAEPLTELLPDGAERTATVCDLLSPEEYRPKKLSKFVAGLGQENVLLVGHMPDVGGYAGWLLGTEEAAVDFEKGAAALVACRKEPAAGAGTLGWLVTPAWFMAG